MARTGPLRPVFYAYSEPRYSLVARILEGISGLLFAVDQRWLVGAQDGNDPLALRPVLRVIVDAASQDARIERLLVRPDRTPDRRGGGPHHADVEWGASSKGLDPEETERALVLMIERYLLDTFGQPQDRPSREMTTVVVEALTTMWVRTLYGPEP